MKSSITPNLHSPITTISNYMSITNPLPHPNVITMYVVQFIVYCCWYAPTIELSTFNYFGHNGSRITAGC